MSLDAMKQALEALEFLALENFVELDKSLNVGPTYGRKAIIALRAAIKEAEMQEPVAWMVYTLDGKSVCVTDNPADFTDQHKALPLYTAPRQWQGLTEDEKRSMVEWAHPDIIDAIELKLRERNT